MALRHEPFEECRCCDKAAETIDLYKREILTASATVDVAGKTFVVVPDVKAEIELLRATLQKHAMTRHYRMAEGGGSVPSGYSCEICEVECGGKLSELRHLSTCPLFPCNHQA